MPALRTLAALGILALAPGIRAGAPIVPDEPDAAHLLGVFPEFKGRSTELADLRHYRQQLEGYREGTLEIFNQAIEAYSNALKEFSSKLEARLARGEIPQGEYDRLIDVHDQGLRRCMATGRFMQAYHTALGKYRAEVRWVVDEMLRLASSDAIR